MDLRLIITKKLRRYFQFYFYEFLTICDGSDVRSVYVQMRLLFKNIAYEISWDHLHERTAVTAKLEIVLSSLLESFPTFFVATGSDHIVRCVEA